MKYICILDREYREHHINTAKIIRVIRATEKFFPTMGYIIIQDKERSIQFTSFENPSYKGDGISGGFSTDFDLFIELLNKESL